MSIRGDFLVVAHKKANAKFPEVFIKAFKRFTVKNKLNFEDDNHYRLMDKESRTTGCGCALCLLRFKYTRVVLARHRVYKRITNDDYVYGIQHTLSDDWALLKSLDTELIEIHLEKSKVKNKLGFIYKRKSYDKSKCT